jgi:RHS repeat-associated protein
MAFGEDFAESGTQEKHHFTSYERDAESGQDYAVNRFHNFNVGRFTSADRASGSPANPQSWNRYSYGTNDPVNRSDQAGLDDDELPFYELSLDDIFAMLDGGGGGGGYGFSEFMDIFAGEDVIVLSTTESFLPELGAGGFGGGDFGVGGFGGGGFDGGDFGGGGEGQDVVPLPNLSQGIQSLLRRGDCGKYVKKLIKRVAANTQVSAYSTNILDVFDRISVQGNIDFSQQTARVGGQQINVAGKAIGSISGGDASIGISPFSSTGLTPYGYQHALYNYVETALHESIHLAAGQGIYVDRQVAQGAFDLLGKKGKRENPLPQSTSAGPYSDYFDQLLQKHCPM